VGGIGEQNASGEDGILNNRDFTFYLCARLLSQVAVQMQSVAVGWQVYALSGDVLDLGLIGLAQFVPFVVLVLPAGQVADHYDRRLIITLCFAVQTLCGLLLLMFSKVGLTATWPIFAVLVLFGGARAFLMPTSQAILVNLVPAENFGRAVALSSSTFHLAVVVGPGLGGALYLAGPVVVYAVVSALFAVSLFLMFNTRSNRKIPAGRETASGYSSGHSLLEGLRFVWTRPAILGALSLDLFAVLFGSATALLPAYASDVLKIGPVGLGLLRTAPAIGAALIAVILTFHPINQRVGRWMFGGVALFGVNTIVFGLSTNATLSFVALAFMGAGDMVSVYIRHLLVQVATPDTIRGRVSAVNSVFIGASNELGEFESGITAKWFGLVPSVIIGGIATLVVTFVWRSLFPVLGRMDHFPKPEKPEPVPPFGKEGKEGARIVKG